MMSIVIKPRLNVAQQFQLSAAVAVATHKLLTKYIEEISIKWPNDIYWRDRKTAGILIENVLKGTDWEWSTIGIGLNVNQTVFPPELPNPVSLKQITRQEHYVIPLGKLLREEVLKTCKQLLENGFDEIYSYYNHHLYKAGEMVKLRKSNAVFETTVKGVELDGMLTVVDSMERSFNMDEVEWVI
jgi:BirA family biotin operon repressor/biotin-[acetyl-CoA-carboxylase] ligase